MGQVTLGLIRDVAFRLATALVFLAPALCHAQVNPPFPVLFVHGLASNGGTWAEMIDSLDTHLSHFGGRFRAAPPGAGGGGTCSYFLPISGSPRSELDWVAPPANGSLSTKTYFAIDFTDPSDLSFPEQGRELKTVIDCVKLVTSSAKLILVAHSMGGLAARSYLQSLTGGVGYAFDVDRLITIGTPHGGARQIVAWCGNGGWLGPLIGRALHDGGSISSGVTSILSGGASIVSGIDVPDCAHIAVQQLAPWSTSISQLNGVAAPFPAIRALSIVGQAGRGWPSEMDSVLADTDGIVLTGGQSLAVNVPYALSNHSSVVRSIANCGKLIPHLCETQDETVIHAVEAELGNANAIVVKTALYSNLTTSSAVLGGTIDNAGFSGYTPRIEWGTSSGNYPNHINGIQSNTLGADSFNTLVGGLVPGQTIYYRLVVTTTASTTVVGGERSFKMPASIPAFLPAPGLSSPGNNATGQSVTPYLTWNAVDNATSYRVMVARTAEALPSLDPSSSDCSACVLNTIATDTAVHIPRNILAPGPTYYWMVKARSPDRYGSWSLIRRFDTATQTPLPAPTISSPMNAAVSTGTMPLITWSDVTGATSYRVMIADNATKLPIDPAEGDCLPCAVNVTVTTTAFSVPAGYLVQPGSYVVQVKARNNQQVGVWSTRVPFTTQNPAISEAVTYDIAASSNGNGTASGGGIVPAGSSVSLYAIPFVGYSFSEWRENGAVVSQNPVLTLTADGNRNLAATFVSSSQYFLVALAASPAGCGTLSGAGWYLAPSFGSSTDFSVSATANTGCIFLGWYEGGSLISASLAPSLSSATGQNRQFTALFGYSMANNPRAPRQLSQGQAGALAVSSDGTIFGWGPLPTGLVPGASSTLTLPTRVTTLDSTGGKRGVYSNSSGVHVILGNRDLYGLGPNGEGLINGELGPVDSSILVLSNVVDVASGLHASLAARADGTVWMWGTNEFNYVNTTNTSGILPPQAIPGLDGIVQVAMGSRCNTALKSDGAVWTWGGPNNSDNGCLGIGVADVRYNNGTPDYTPHQLPTLSQIVQISCGDEFCMALRQDGVLFGWGYNASGQIGDGSFTTRYGPVQVPLSNVVSVTAGYQNTFAITSAGQVYAWGNSNYGALGFASGVPGVSTPTLVAGLPAIEEISANGTQTLARDRAGNLWAWGFNANGSLGVGSTTNVTTPAQVHCPQGMVGFFNVYSDQCRLVVTPLAGSNGSIFPSTSQLLTRNASIRFSVQPAPGYKFVVQDLCGGVVSGNQITTGPVNAACNVSVSFVPDSVGLSVARTGSGSGTVVSTPAGIDCGGTCSTRFAPGTAVTLSAAPGAGAYFTGWSGACTGTVGCTLSMDADKSVTAGFAPATAIPRMSNISTRGQVLTGNDVMIAGFIIGGATPKTVVINVAGPNLVNFGIASPLANPTLTLVRSLDQSIIATNDDWQSQAIAADVAAILSSGFQPNNVKEPAIIATLAPGAYTAIVSGVGGTTGAALVGVFEVDHPETPLANISTRGQVLTGNDVMIAGFIVQGASAKTVVVNVAGPNLVNFGITNALADPTLTIVRSSDQAIIASNDDWQTQANSQDVAAIQATGFQPNNAKEPAVILTLQPGAYTAIVSGKNNTTGVGLVGVFAVP